MALIQIPLNDVFRSFNDGGLVLFGGKFDFMPCGSGSSPTTCCAGKSRLKCAVK